MALKVWLPFNGNLDNQVLNKITINTNGTTSYTDGKIGQGLNCNGSSNWRIPNINIGSQASFCCWAKTSVNGKMPWVLDCAVNKNLNLYCYNIYTLNTGDSNNNPFLTDSNSNISVLTDNMWHHFVVTFNGSQAKLYIDGIYRGKAKTYKSPQTNASHNTLKIAGDFNSQHNYDFNGILNDFRVYDYCLSPKEVKEISKGLILHYKLDSNYGNNIIYDCSGYKNNGSAIGTLILSDNSTRYNHSTSFDGNTNGILIENLNISNILNTEFTYSFWINPNGENRARSIYFGNYPNSPCFSIEKNTSNKLRFYWNGSPDLVTNLTINDNNWQHIGITKKGTSEIKVYLNGSLIQILTDNCNNLTFPNTFKIGRDNRSGDGTPYKGLMSDFRIYATALSDDDMLELYNNPANIDNQGNMFCYEFDEAETSKQQILENDITQIDNFIEINDKIKVLSDGSVFLQILHHNQPSSNLFTVSNCWLNNTSNLYSGLILLKTIFKNQSEYEFLACEKAESSTSSETQFRWKQTSNPALSSSITGKTIISGNVSHNEGLKTTGSYAAIHNGNTWWGACGSYTVWENGIPGFNSVIKSGYLDLYIKIPEDVLKGNIENFLKFFKKSILSTQFLEK